MSAFIVENDTIARILFILEITNRDIGSMDRVASVCTSGNVNGLDSERKRAIGQAMLDLNVASVNARYRGNEVAMPYVHHVCPCTKLQALKSLKCFLYQSCEEHCDDLPLFKALDSVAGDLAMDIIYHLPEYESAEWD